jgi:hypothetical protein
MKTLMMIPLLVVLTTCGGGGGSEAPQAGTGYDVTPAQELVTDSRTGGSTSAPKPEQVPTPSEGAESGSEQAAEGCKVPRASAQGIAHGKPPVERCDSKE